MSDYNMNYRKSQSIYTRQESKKKALNNAVNVMRGGIRL